MFKSDNKVPVYYYTDQPYDSKIAEVAPDLAALLGHLLEVSKRPPHVPGLSVPVCGADGVQLQQAEGALGMIFHPKTRLVPVVTVLYALLKHLELEVYVDESQAHHPIKIRSTDSPGVGETD